MSSISASLSFLCSPSAVPFVCSGSGRDAAAESVVSIVESTVVANVAAAASISETLLVSAVTFTFDLSSSVAVVDNAPFLAFSAAAAALAAFKMSSSPSIGPVYFTIMINAN